MTEKPKGTGRKPRTGCIYEEETCDGRHRRESSMAAVRYMKGVGRVVGTKRRWVGVITVNYKRYRFRSTNRANVEAFIQDMLMKYGR